MMLGGSFLKRSSPQTPLQRLSDQRPGVVSAVPAANATPRLGMPPKMVRQEAVLLPTPGLTLAHMSVGSSGGPERRDERPMSRQHKTGGFIQWWCSACAGDSRPLCASPRSEVPELAPCGAGILPAPQYACDPTAAARPSVEHPPRRVGTGQPLGEDGGSARISTPTRFGNTSVCGS